MVSSLISSLLRFDDFPQMLNSFDFVAVAAAVVVVAVFDYAIADAVAVANSFVVAAYFFVLVIASVAYPLLVFVSPQLLLSSAPSPLQALTPH